MFSSIFFLLLDFDECNVRSDDCQQVCVNTHGSFRCECHSGFMLEKDRKSCQGILTSCPYTVSELNLLMRVITRGQKYANFHSVDQL